MTEACRFLLADFTQRRRCVSGVARAASWIRSTATCRWSRTTLLFRAGTSAVRADLHPSLTYPRGLQSQSLLIPNGRTRDPDDCCKGYGYSQNLSAVYKLLRKHDPYHVTTGATECNELQAFQEPYLSLDFPSECTRRLRSGPQTSCVTLACRDSTAQKRKPILLPLAVFTAEQWSRTTGPILPSTRALSPGTSGRRSTEMAATSRYDCRR